MLVQVSPEERARRLGDVAAMLIEWGRAAIAEDEARAAREADVNSEEPTASDLQPAAEQANKEEVGLLT